MNPLLSSHHFYLFPMLIPENSGGIALNMWCNWDANLCTSGASLWADTCRRSRRLMFWKLLHEFSDCWLQLLVGSWDRKWTGLLSLLVLHVHKTRLKFTDQQLFLPFLRVLLWRMFDFIPAWEIKRNISRLQWQFALIETFTGDLI